MFLIFALLGLGLEALHGFKVGWYLDVGNETRRLMMVLAHEHGTLLALVNIAFGLSIGHFGRWSNERLELASRALRIASILLPGGFFLGGLYIYDGDPGLGIVLSPFGALAFVVALAVTIQGVRAK